MKKKVYLRPLRNEGSYLSLVIGLVLLWFILEFNLVFLIPLVASCIFLIMVGCLGFLIFMILLHCNHKIYYDEESIFVQSMWRKKVTFRWQDIKQLKQTKHSLVIQLKNSLIIVLYPSAFDYKNIKMIDFFSRLIDSQNN